MVAQTTWERVVKDVCDRIRSGETPVGSKIASIDWLAKRNQVARGTVNRALEHLAGRGIVEPRHGSGNFVLRVPADDELTPAPSLEERLAALERRMDALERRPVEDRAHPSIEVTTDDERL